MVFARFRPKHKAAARNGKAEVELDDKENYTRCVTRHPPARWPQLEDEVSTLRSCVAAYTCTNPHDDIVARCNHTARGSSYWIPH
jgi:hypothetical protein